MSCAKPGRPDEPTGTESPTPLTRAKLHKPSSGGWKNWHAPWNQSAQTCTQGFMVRMLGEYFQGTLPQLIERARLLKAKIPRTLPRDYEGLIRTCEIELGD